ncbi:MAG: YigZ family protein [Ignavibacteriae bacterium]|nr:YigZ family protein [Ignavibacteriota bacterium]MCB9216081.1 YigZ family protein [Ignavibacteria bacterium]
MNQPLPIQTIKERARSEIKVRGSRFIATAIPVSSKDEANDVLDQIRKEFWDATHNCFAYQLAPNGAEYRFSDDGEPSGTAGKPILFAMQQRDLLDVLVVVTRYFGGTKLGAGGLARAYAEATNNVLDQVSVVVNWPTTRIRVFTPYDDLSEVRRLVEAQTEEFDEEFRDVVIYTASIRDDRLKRFADELTEKTAGRAGLVNIDIAEAE